METDAEFAVVSVDGNEYRVEVEPGPLDSAGVCNYRWHISGWGGPAKGRWFDSPSAALLDGIEFLLDALAEQEASDE